MTGLAENAFYKCALYPRVYDGKINKMRKKWEILKQVLQLIFERWEAIFSTEMTTTVTYHFPSSVD